MNRATFTNRPLENEQENTVRGRVRFYNDKHERRRTREVTGIAENVKLNRSLWSLAEKMAQLKAA